MQGGLILIDGSHDNTIHDNKIAISPVEAPMGMNYAFTNVCYASNDIGLPPNPCKGSTGAHRLFLIAERGLSALVRTRAPVGQALNSPIPMIVPSGPAFGQPM
jgi:hypothetical protein